MPDAVLDSSAVLARIWREPGFERVDAVIAGALISSVNVAEVIQKLVERGADDATARDILDSMPLRPEPLDVEAGIRTGLLRRATRRAGLSLGDRACLELALRKAMPVYTADRAWAELDLGVEVVLIR
ncbi:type II toxin-antitoxin system VapC family toxin [Phenylobacterium sp.]|uniref:type II toxin-antitoxin system VapC family toxin n=1 Tax=Phenylobacterium sp. TaxID=1871053 RepID=UPI0025E0AC24|nr:type II toxin-antitoxin system VapC family toxin [Phenylobacterium sp.]MBX3485701.1 type II toxin-antitoxin system VapC family toxin [Phenylobacterium sp.]